MAEGLFTRLRAWFRSLLGRGRAEVDTDAEAETTAASRAVEAGYQCEVCGTPVESPDEPCPLCHSTAVVPADAGAGNANAAGEEDTGPEAVERRVADSQSGDAAASLADLRDAGKDVLARHADKWEERESGGSRRYRVTLPAGEERVVDSREDVRSLLYRNYGVDDGDDGEARDHGTGDP